MTSPLSLIGRTYELTGLRDGLSGGFAKFYTGDIPAKPDDTTGQTLLGAIPLASPVGVLGSASALATLTLTTPRVVAAVASGTIGWVRICNAAGDGILDLPAGLAGSAMPVIVNVLEIFANGELQLVSCVIAK